MKNNLEPNWPDPFAIDDHASMNDEPECPDCGCHYCRCPEIEEEEIEEEEIEDNPREATLYGGDPTPYS